jgi:hypothetical protein
MKVFPASPQRPSLVLACHVDVSMDAAATEAQASSIMNCHHELMEARHVQARLSGPEYDAVLAAARKGDLTIQEAVRIAVLRWAEARGTYRDPFQDFIGISKGGNVRDASERIDEIAYGDPHGERRKVR